MKQEVIQYNSSIAGTEYLSSFYLCSIVVRAEDKKGNKVLLKFSSVEQGFQFFKTQNPVFREKIMNCGTPSKARYFGSAKAGCPVRDNWDDIKDKVMFKLVFAKFRQSLLLTSYLLSTDDIKLVEYSPWDKVDNYWGVNEKGEGKNKHGRITMRVREKIAGLSLNLSKLQADDLIPDMSKYY